jgi:hypothetical protein
VDFTILYNIRIIILCGNRSDRGIQTWFISKTGPHCSYFWSAVLPG